jgi:hypothetical protein
MSCTNDAGSTNILGNGVVDALKDGVRESVLVAEGVVETDAIGVVVAEAVLPRSDDVAVGVGVYATETDTLGSASDNVMFNTIVELLYSLTVFSAASAAKSAAKPVQKPILIRCEETNRKSDCKLANG